MSNTWGHIFRVTTFGESHGAGVGCIIDNCPPGYKIDQKSIQTALNRRRPGQSSITSPRNETDKVEILSGLEEGITLGTPLTLYVQNQDARPSEYKNLNLRPGHADFTTLKKYGVLAKSGGGRSSARETIARVAAGDVAKQILSHNLPKYRTCSFVQTVGQISCTCLDSHLEFTQEQVDKTSIRCPCPKHSEDMIQLIESIKKSGDSIGGHIRTIVQNPPKFIGEPLFQKVPAVLASAMMSIPASRGFEIGHGFESTELLGSEHNDPLTIEKEFSTMKSNNAGGVLGGMTTGLPINFRVAFKPTSTIQKPQESLNRKGEKVENPPHSGRHDPCVLPRAVPIVEAMTHLAIIDLWLQQSMLESIKGPECHNDF